MPAGEAGTPGRRKAYLTRRELPEREVARVSLLGVDRDAYAFLQITELESAARAIAREPGHVEVDAVGSFVGDALRLKLLDNRDIFSDMLACSRHFGRELDVQGVKVFNKSGGIFVSNGFQSFERHRQVFTRERLHHFVITIIRVRSEVSDIGNVHYLLHVVAIVLERPAHDISEHIRTQVPDVRIVVDRRPARIQADNAVFKRFELLFFTGEGVVER